jgi:hypothetical protein
LEVSGVVFIHHLPNGQYHHLTVPDKARSHISLYFIEVPKSEGKDVILVVVDRFTKFNHFIPYLFYVKKIVDLFHDHVTKFHGPPSITFFRPVDLGKICSRL